MSKFAVAVGSLQWAVGSGGWHCLLLLPTATAYCKLLNYRLLISTA